MNKILAAVLFLATALSSLNAANYFIDYVGGADTNAGTSSGAAFKHCPGDPAATGTAASTTPTAGDTIFFKGGVSYVFTGSTGIILGASGASGNLITYDGNSAENWGTGRAILTDNHGANAIAAFSHTAARSYLSFKHFEIANIGGSASLPTDTGSAVASRNGYVWVSNGASAGPGITFDDFYAHDLGYSYNTQPMDQNSVDGCGFVMGAGAMPKGVTISNGEIARVNCGISAGGDAASGMALSLLNVKIHDSVRWCIDIHGNAVNAQVGNILIQGCELYDYYQLTAGNWTGYGAAPHVDGIFIRSYDVSDSANITWGSFKIDRCKFYSTTAAVNNSSTASIYATEGPSVTITNSTFVYSLGSRTIYFVNTTEPDQAQAINLYNNSFIINYTPAYSIDSNGGGTGVYSNLTFNWENNLVYDVATGSGNNFCVYLNPNATLGGVLQDYNFYKTFNTSGTSYGGTDGKDFFNWTGTGGAGEGGITLLRAHSPAWETHGDSVDMKYVTVNATDSSLCNLHLQSSSPARGAGVNLHSLGITELDTDMAGNARPSTGAWDLGAYNDSTAGAGTPAVPTNYRKPRTMAGGF